ncbi:enoyl-CoA hydratase-related protein [Halomonas sp. H5]|uniref:enoyl-CoA hydratase-related protein n=1 Tax=Halomonas sp. H5 TaxID=3423910 RepID=UPI003D364F8D
MTATLQSHATDGVLTLTLNRPEALNALSAELYHRLADHLAAADRDPAIRVVVIRGAGRSFCAGNDLGDFLEPSRDALAGPRRLLHTLATLETPLVAAVQGHAVGIGTTLLLHCDQIVCGEQARFLLPFTRLGLVPEGGSTRLLPEWLGHPRAFSLLVMGEPCDAATARDLGLVNEVVPDEALGEALERRVARLLALPDEAVRQGKRLLRGQGRREALEQAIEEELAHFSRLLAGEEAQRALYAAQRG